MKTMRTLSKKSNLFPGGGKGGRSVEADFEELCRQATAKTLDRPDPDIIQQVRLPCGPSLQHNLSLYNTSTCLLICFCLNRLWKASKAIQETLPALRYIGTLTASLASPFRLSSVYQAVACLWLCSLWQSL